MAFTSDLTAYNALESGKSYQVFFSYIYYLSGTLEVRLGTVLIGTVSAAGSYMYSGTSDGTDLVLTAVDFEGEFKIGSVMIAETDDLYSDPIVISSSTYEEKKKNKLKNILYDIAYQKAYDKNLQRG